MIKITRKRSKHDAFRKYIVWLNNEKKGTLSNGGSLSISAPKGKNVIKITIDWCSSSEIEFDYDDDKTINFECYCSLKGKIIPISLSYLTTKKDEYIKLYRV